MRFRWSYIILYSIAGVIALLPFRGTDVAVLSPAEAVWASVEAGIVCLKTDGGDLGMGATVAEALENMKQTASGTVFLDTADYLIVKKGSEALIAQMRSVLRPSCRVCVAESDVDLPGAAAFLRIHKPSAQLKSIDSLRENLPRLQLQKGRLILIESKATDSSADSMAGDRHQRTMSDIGRPTFVDGRPDCRGSGRDGLPPSASTKSTGLA